MYLLILTLLQTTKTDTIWGTTTYWTHDKKHHLEWPHGCGSLPGLHTAGVEVLKQLVRAL